MADKPLQFQMAFVAEQDRIRLRISTRDKAEYRLWLTRHLVRSLWDALLKLLDAGIVKDTPIEADTREEILHFEHQAAVEQADFATPFAEAADSFPLGEEGVLVTSIQGSRKANGAYALTLRPRQGNGISVNLDDKLMHSFMQMLIDCSNSAQWSLGLRLPESKSTTVTDAPPHGKVVRH